MARFKATTHDLMSQNGLLLLNWGMARLDKIGLILRLSDWVAHLMIR
jgi:hypothetical protein